jgi:AcrR family transcriptional regulator
MRLAQSVEDINAVRDNIVDAAGARYRVFGFRKTNMAEVAADVGMSTANLYRYFLNKQDLAAACAGRYMDERITALSQAIDIPEGTAMDRLGAYLQRMLEYTYQTASNQPTINELVDIVAEERPDIARAKHKLEQQLLEAIIVDGNASEELKVPDPAPAARAIHSAIAVTRVPLFTNFYSLSELKEFARQLLQILMNGLSRP